MLSIHKTILATYLVLHDECVKSLDASRKRTVIYTFWSMTRVHNNLVVIISTQRAESYSFFFPRTSGKRNEVEILHIIYSKLMI